MAIVLVLSMSFTASTFEVPTCSYEEIEDGYGTIIGESSAKKYRGLTIPFYSNTVIEGRNFEFECRPPVTCRTAEIHVKSIKETVWLERHMYLTQLFMGVGGKEPFLMVLGKPTHDRKDLNDEQKALPDLNNVRAFIIPPGSVSKSLFKTYFSGFGNEMQLIFAYNMKRLQNFCVHLLFIKRRDQFSARNRHSI